MARPFHIDPEISRASTLPGEVYRDPEHHSIQRERVFARSWQLIPAAPPVDEVRPGHALPWTLLPGCLDEPLLLTRDRSGRQHCLSNVCTHRGNLVLTAATACSGLRCGYHGRRFDLRGRFLGMPGFEGVENFPGPSDDLQELKLERWGPLAFTSIDPAFELDTLLEPVRARVDGLGIERLRFDAHGSRDYDVRANWALYCDNYLEGFHIPFVHSALAATLDYEAYRTEVFALANLQLGIGNSEDAVFDLPDDHPDSGQRVAAFYFWLFPNMMFNFYPWGLSVNLVEPVAVDRTRVRFLTYIRDERLRDQGAGADLDRVEQEDEAIVEACQRGLRSRLYRSGRYSPRREVGVHHFHRLLARFMFDAEVSADLDATGPRP